MKKISKIFPVFFLVMDIIIIVGGVTMKEPVIEIRNSYKMLTFSIKHFSQIFLKLREN
ncbi:SHP2/SHP3 family peptide pheromone [Staphylococcus ursi]|nr:SHP2/SHP3 family peptide pheromone [Staphylococcus sp. MI 10-1553]